MGAGKQNQAPGLVVRNAMRYAVSTFACHVLVDAGMADWTGPRTVVLKPETSWRSAQRVMANEIKSERKRGYR